MVGGMQAAKLKEKIAAMFEGKHVRFIPIPCRHFESWDSEDMGSDVLGWFGFWVPCFRFRFRVLGFGF